MKIHEKYIRRCIQLAENGLGRTWPNPMVGSVVVLENRIIGEGWHQKAGEPHAEVNAINSVKDQSLLKKATIYVSLEPCSHFGKTPPCSDLIIARGIKRVVIGTVDPFSEVSGRGIKKLMDAGCEVTVGILDRECRDLNKRFFSYHTRKRPYVILKWAETANGYLAPKERAERAPVWISNQYSKQLVHKWRAEEQAILVGTNTAIADNPRLDARLWEGENPVRIVLDRSLRLPADSALLDGSVKTIVITELPQDVIPEENSMKKFPVIFEKANFNDLPAAVCEILFRYELQSVIIEGGSQTLDCFIKAGLWDEARVFTGAGSFPEGIKAPTPGGKLVYERRLQSDNLKIYKND